MPGTRDDALATAIKILKPRRARRARRAGGAGALLGLSLGAGAAHGSVTKERE